MTDARRAPDVDYLTRDYEGFRQLLISLLDRSRTEWSERAAADLGVMLVEILANQLDLLSYAGDRVAEESFVGTARRRESVRRHAALGDYSLDRGNATRGLQQFRLQAGTTKRLPAGTQVAPTLQPGQDPERRIVAETMAEADLDARRNDLSLDRSVAAGSTLLHLRAADGTRVDLRAIGLRAGMQLVIMSRDSGEVITLAGVQSSAVTLADPLQDTYIAGSDDNAARVLGNMVSIRRGRRSDWELCGRGGAALGEVAPGVFFARRIDQIRRLRDEAEQARDTWITDRSLAGWWELAGATVTRVVRRLRETDATALGADRLKQLDEELWSAADLLRQLLTACGRAVSEEMQPSRRVTLPRQEIELFSEEPPLWLDGMELLSVRVGVAGRWTAWSRVDDFLRSQPDDRHFELETNIDGQVLLRFGDGIHGALLPADSLVMVRRVTGDVFGGDLGAKALEVVVGGAGGGFDSAQPTANPLPTSGARPPEDLDKVALEIGRALAIPAIPVTTADYAELLEARSDVAEVVVSAAKGRVDVVLRPEPGEDVARVLGSVRSYLQQARLAGTHVWLRLAEPMFVSVALVIEIHPEIPASDLRLRLRRALLDSFGPQGARLLGRTRTRAEVYAVVEAVAGVVWSQVIGFDRADEPQPAAAEQIVPAPHQIVRCLDLPGRPLNGTIVIWAARRYRLQIELAYPDPDDRPDVTRLLASLTALLSGPDSAPVQEACSEITVAAVNAWLKTIPPPGADYRLSVLVLMVGQRAVDRIPLLAGELPIIQIRDRLYTPHYRLQIELAYADANQAPSQQALSTELQALLSGPDAAPVQQRWREITVPRLNALLAGVPQPGQDYRLRVLSLMAGSRAVDRIPLLPGEVPILDELHIAAVRRPL